MSHLGAPVGRCFYICFVDVEIEAQSVFVTLRVLSGKAGILTLVLDMEVCEPVPSSPSEREGDENKQGVPVDPAERVTCAPGRPCCEGASWALLSIGWKPVSTTGHHGARHKLLHSWELRFLKQCGETRT